MRAAGCNYIPDRGATGRPRVKRWSVKGEQGTIQVYYRGERIAFSELKEPMQKAVAPRRPSDPREGDEPAGQRASLAAALSNHEATE